MTDDHLLSQHLQDSFVFLCITSDSFLEIVRPSLSPSYLSNTVSSNCVRICYDYYDMFKCAPKDHFHDEFHRRLPDVPERDKVYYVQYLQKLSSSFTPPSEDYVLKRFSEFCKYQEFEKAAIRFAELIREEKFEEAQNLMYSALKSGVEKENIGLDYLTDLSNLVSRGLVEEVLTSTGISALDSFMRGGFRRGEFVVVMGGYKGKKSWFMLNSAKAALLKGLKVLYLTHEMSAALVERRMDRALGALTSGEYGNSVCIRVRNEKSGLITEIKEKRPSVLDTEKVKEVRRKAARFGGRLIVKKYPMGTCTIEELHRYLRYLERFEAFVPDVIVNDYADIMSFPSRSDSPRHGLNELYIQHKAIGDELGCVIITASQVNREAIRRKEVRMEHVAEDIRKMGNVDAALAVSQTDEMAEQGVGSVSVVARRDGIMGVSCSVLMNLDIGQFCTSSW